LHLAAWTRLSNSQQVVFCTLPPVPGQMVEDMCTTPLDPGPSRMVI